MGTRGPRGGLGAESVSHSLVPGRARPAAWSSSWTAHSYQRKGRSEGTVSPHTCFAKERESGTTTATVLPLPDAILTL